MRRSTFIAKANYFLDQRATNKISQAKYFSQGLVLYLFKKEKANHK